MFAIIAINHYNHGIRNYMESNFFFLIIDKELNYTLTKVNQYALQGKYYGLCWLVSPI